MAPRPSYATDAGRAPGATETARGEDDPDDGVPDPHAPPERGAAQLTETFRNSVAEGEDRLGRSLPALLATGAVGGMDVGMGVLALLLVEHETGSVLLGGLAFGIGFIALTLANSELFTENFLVPIAALAARRAGVGALARLWLGTLVSNLAGGWVLMVLLVSARPELKATAIHAAQPYVDASFVEALAAAILGGLVITLMTWMERSTPSVPGKLAGALSAAFVLAAGRLNHAIVVSLLLFGALQAGAPFGYADWLRVLAVACLGNMVGGLGLVTGLRLVQVGSRRMAHVEADA